MVASIQAVGVVLISAFLNTPAAASLVTNSLPRMMLLSSSIAVFSGLTGLYASYYLNVVSGAAIMLARTACFVAASVVRAARRGPETKEAGGGHNTPRKLS